jgi:acyl-CoA reductase-like NAD-dependent aldehyde dehydrogenase
MTLSPLPAPGEIDTTEGVPATSPIEAATAKNVRVTQRALTVELHDGRTVSVPIEWYFPFGGARDSFFGDLKVHGRDAFEFYTDKKVTISRWF